MITRIIIHCTATRRGRHVSIEDIHAWHRARGMRCCGYHYVVYLDGSVHIGRPEQAIGAHCLGYNRSSIGVCYVGGLNADGSYADTRTAAQKRALLQLLRELKERYPKAEILGHRDLAAKACPCFDARKEYRALGSPWQTS